MAIVLFLGTGSGGSIGAAAQVSTTGGVTGGGTPGWTITYIPTTCVWESHGQYGDSNGAWPAPYNACTVGVGGVNGPPWPTKYGSCACSGTVKAHLVWSGGSTGEPPPPVVLVEEHSSAQGYGDSGDCDCGLPNVVTTPNAGGVLKEGHRWTAVTTNGETSLDVPVTCSPSASAAIAQSSMKDAGGCSAEYHIVPHNVTLALTGTLPTKHILIGQELIAEVFVDGHPVKAGDGLTSTSDTIDWGVTGGCPFQSFTASNSSATYEGWDTDDQNPTSVYFRRPSDTEIWITANVTLASIGETLLVGDHFHLDGPAPLSMQLNLGSGPDLMSPDGLGSWIEDLYVPAIYQMWGATYGGNTWGVFFIGTVATPSAYISRGYGQWSFTQLITSIHESRMDQTRAWWDADWNFGPGFKLDNTYPYGAWHTADSIEQNDSDAPSLPASPWIGLEMSIGFKVYQLYDPPPSSAGGHMVTPLREFDWSCSGDASRDSGHLPPWTINSRSASQADGGYYPAHPIWTSRLTNGTTWHLR